MTLAVALIAAGVASTSLLGNLALLGTIIAAAVLFGGAIVKGFNWHSNRAVERSKIDEVLLTLKKTGPDAQKVGSVSDVLEHHGEILGQIRNDYVGQEDHALLVNSVANAAAGLGRIESELASFKKNTADHRLVEESDNKTAREQTATIVASIAGLGTGLVKLEGSIQTVVQEYRVQKAHTDSVEEGVSAQLIAQLEQFKSYVTRNEFSLLTEAVQRIEAIDNAQLELQKSFATRTELAVLTEMVKRLEVVVTDVVEHQIISTERVRVADVAVTRVSEETTAAARVVAGQQLVQDDRLHELESTDSVKASDTRDQLQTIHTLVNGRLTAVTQDALDTSIRELALLQERDNPKDAARIAGLVRHIADLRVTINDRNATQEKVDSAKVKPPRNAKGHFIKT